MAEAITLEFIAKQNELLMKEVRSFREDMNVMMEILRRQEHNINSLSSQLTDMHAYNRRVEARVATLEQQP